MRLALVGGDWPLQLRLDATTGVDRVEIEINGRHLETVYGPTFHRCRPMIQAIRGLFSRPLPTPRPRPSAGTPFGPRREIGVQGEAGFRPSEPAPGVMGQWVNYRIMTDNRSMISLHRVGSEPRVKDPELLSVHRGSGSAGRKTGCSVPDY